MSNFSLSFPVTVQNEDSGEETVQVVKFRVLGTADGQDPKDIAECFNRQLEGALGVEGLLFALLRGPAGPEPTPDPAGANGPGGDDAEVP